MNTISDKVFNWLYEQIKPVRQGILVVIPTGKLLDKLLLQWYEGTGND